MARFSPSLPRPSPSLYLLPLLLSFPLLTFPVSRPPVPLPLPLTHNRSHRAPTPHRQLVLVPVTYGGTGNQLYFLLQAIHLAHVFNATLILPPPPPRNIPNRSGAPSSHLVDTVKLSTFVPLADQLPRQCDNSFKHIIHAHRGRNAPKSFSSRVLTIACHFTNPHLSDVRRCGEQALRHSAIHDLHLPLSHVPNLSLYHLLKTLSGCVILDGHSYNRAGEKAQEALHSYLHYVQPSQTIRDLADVYDVDVVVHLRYDEHECFRKRLYQDGMVCVRTRLSTREGLIQWVEPQVFVDAIVAEVMNRNLRTVYLAFSPYTPHDMVEKLQHLFQQHMTLIPRIQEEELDIENLVERQLATNAKLFIGDFGSTWSGTVYYKRRTLNKVTLWGCRLLDRCYDLGYYRFEGVLREPLWFESLGLL